MTLTLEPLTLEDWPRVAHIRIAPQQEKFSGQVRDAFAHPQDGVDFHGVFEDGNAVGFFKIDRLYHTRMAYAAPGQLGLRAFIIDIAEQGRGLATSVVAMLPGYLPKHYDATVLLLTVNKSNPGATRAYLRGGFYQTGQTYLLGIAGPQWVMRMDLPQSEL